MNNFQDVGSFHCKFNVDHADCDGCEVSVSLGLTDMKSTVHEKGQPGPREVPQELLEFRLKFLLEELQEIGEGTGYELIAHDVSGKILWEKVGCSCVDHAKVFDGLLDLAYVTFGMAHVFGYPWQDGWDEVQRANMSKKRCGIDHKFIGGIVDRCMYVGDGGQCGKPQVDHSQRGSKYDVIKPAGWLAPDIKGVLESHDFNV